MKIFPVKVRLLSISTGALMVLHSASILASSAEFENIDLATLNTTQGFRIGGAVAGDYSGASVSAAWDINLQDILIGAKYADPSGRAFAGSGYAIYARDSGYEAPIDLASNATQAFNS